MIVLDAEAVPFFTTILIGAILAGVLFVTANALNARKSWGRVVGILLAVVKADQRMLGVPTKGE